MTGGFPSQMPVTQKVVPSPDVIMMLWDFMGSVWDNKFEKCLISNVKIQFVNNHKISYLVYSQQTIVMMYKHHDQLAEPVLFLLIEG